MTRTRSSGGKTSDKFQPDDRVFAKVKGRPPWPAKVLNRVEWKGESYNVLFYGTYDTRVLKLDSLFIYNEANKAEYSKPKNRNRWKEAMEEIEKNIPIEEGGPMEEKLPKTKPAKSQGRKRGLPKLDSISSTSSAATEVSTTPAASATTPVTESIRRSGRHVKPKASSQVDSSSEGPTYKRAKREDAKVVTMEIEAEKSKGRDTTVIDIHQEQKEYAEKSTPNRIPESIPGPVKPSPKNVSSDVMIEAMSSIKAPVVVSSAPNPDMSLPKPKAKGKNSPVQQLKPKAKTIAATPVAPPAQQLVAVESETEKSKSDNITTTVVVVVPPQQKKYARKSIPVRSPEFNTSPVKTTGSSVRKISSETMMAVVSSITGPIVGRSTPKVDTPGPLRRKLKVEMPPPQQFKAKVKPAVASPAELQAQQPGAVEILTEKSKSRNTTAAVVQTQQKGYAGKPTPIRNTESNPSPIKQTDSSLKTVSLEAMILAVSSIKMPVVSSTPKVVMSELHKPKTKVKTSAAHHQLKPKLVSATPATSIQPDALEIVREKGGNTMVVMQQQQKGDAQLGGDGVVDDDHESETDSYDDMELEFEHEEDIQADREFERFHSELKNVLQLPGRWTMGGVQWDPQGKRKVILISEPEIPPNGRPLVKRCLQLFEDKSIRVFIDQMDMTDVFGMTCDAEKEDVASLIDRIADASSCCGVPEIVVDDLVHFPDVRKRNTSYFAPTCPGVISNDAYDPICTPCKDLQVLVKEKRIKEKLRLQERRIISEQKMFQHPFGKAMYTMFSDLVDETDPNKRRKKRAKETYFRKFLHDTRLNVNGDTASTERIYIEKPISVDSVSQSFQDIVSKLGFNIPNAKKTTSGSMLPRPTPPTHTSTPRPSATSVSRLFPGDTSNLHKMDRKQGSSFTLDDGQENELIGQVKLGPPQFVQRNSTPASTQQQLFEIIQMDDEAFARLASSNKNQVVVLPESGASSSLPITVRIDLNDPNLSQILKAINTLHRTGSK